MFYSSSSSAAAAKWHFFYLLSDTFTLYSSFLPSAAGCLKHLRTAYGRRSGITATCTNHDKPGAGGKWDARFIASADDRAWSFTVFCVIVTTLFVTKFMDLTLAMRRSLLQGQSLSHNRTSFC
jgi:hypothetical protein